MISDAVPPNWYSDLADQAVRENIPLKTWSYMMHSSKLSKDFFFKLKDAGVEVINFGTESLNDRILSLMRKQASSEVAERNIIDASLAGIRLIINLIPDYPTTTFEEALDGSRKVERLVEYIEVINPQMFDLTAGTEIARKPSLHELSINENAYQRTSHGYHSLRFQREVGLSQTQRVVVKKIYANLATIAKRRARLSKIDYESISLFSQISFDRGALLVESEFLEVYIPAMQARLIVNDWELTALKRVYNEFNGRITFSQLKSTMGFVDDQPVILWLRKLIRFGLIESITTRSKSKDLGILPLNYF